MDIRTLHHSPVPQSAVSVRAGHSPERGGTRSSGALSGSHLTLPLAVLVVILVLLGGTVYVGLQWPAHGDLLMVAQALLLAAGLGAIVLMVFRIRQQLLNPLGELRKWSQRIRAGDLSTHIPLPAQGDFANLIRDVNSLTDELNVLTEEMDAKVRAQTEHIANKSRSLEILYDVATNLSTARDLDDLLEQFLDILMTLVDARAASVRLLTGHQTRLVVSRGLRPEVVEQELLVDVNRCMCGRIAQHGGLGIQKGIEACNQFLDCSMVAGNCSEVVVVPLQYRDHILGVYNLFLDRPSAELGRDARDLLNSIGKHLGLAIEKARLDDNARRLAIMEERNMIGNELHDSLAQSLVSMRLQVKMLGEILHRKDVRSAQQEVRQLRTAIDEAHSSLRELLANFRSRMDDRGLVHAISDVLDQLHEETGIHTFFQNECGGKDTGLSPAQEIQIFRIVQEALSNVRKHSNACNVRVLMSRRKNSECSILIEDDGLGIDAAPSRDRPGEHVGLSIMRDRAARIHGQLLIESEPGEGTRVDLTFPTTLPKQNPLEDPGLASTAHR